MRIPLRSPALFLLATYLLLSALVLLPLLFGRPVGNLGLLVAASLASWLAVWSVLGRPALFHALLLPAFLALPVEIYLQAYFGQGITAHHLGVLAETSPAETIEFLGRKGWLLAVTLVFVLCWFALAWRAAWSTRVLDWHGPSRLAVLCLLGLGVSLWIYGGASVAGSGGAHGSVSAAKGGQLPDWAHIRVDTPALAASWPFGIVLHGQAYWKERRYLTQLAGRGRQFRFHAQTFSPPDQPRIVVVVLGESSRADRWSLNGYARRTNPLLGKEDNVVSLTDMVTPVSATRLSVPVIMSRKPAVQSLRAGFSETSFLSAYREAGFRTYWLSNQMSFGEFDTPVSVFAKEADVTRFLNLGGFRDHSSLDEILLDPLREVIADPAPRKLVVLHTLGNHWNYSHRYPEAFNRFLPSLFGVDKPAYTDLKLKEQINNSYDNSILYTDWFLSQVIGMLKTAPGIAAMMYVADHGQTLYDGSCKLAFHGHNTQFEFHVPALVWFSDAYRSAHPDKVAQLRRHKDMPLSTENIFHSVLDLADIRYPTEQLDRSIFSTQWTRHPRYVDSYGWTDYDDASFRGDCREVISRKTPLPRER